MTLMVLVFDWRLGLIDIERMLLFLVTVSARAKKYKNNVHKRQAAQENLIDVILETVQGMRVLLLSLHFILTSLKYALDIYRQ